MMMDQKMPVPEMPNPKEVCIPSASLAIEGDESSVPPAVGDDVEFKASGKVTRVEGDKTYIAVDSVNGNPITDEEANEPADDEASEGEDIRGKAMESDKMDL